MTDFVHIFWDCSVRSGKGEQKMPTPDLHPLPHLRAHKVPGPMVPFRLPGPHGTLATDLLARLQITLKFDIRIKMVWEVLHPLNQFPTCQEHQHFFYSIHQ